MSLPQPPLPAKLIIGILLRDRSTLPNVVFELVARFGKIDMVSPWYDFGYTDYYEKEMGSPLFRRFLVFQSLIAQQALPDIKQATFQVENKFTHNGCRNANIDPGYLLPERFVLSTGKNFSHRIYLRNGIYADLTLIFRHGAFHSLPWTYPDYQSGQIQMFFLKVRQKYTRDLKSGTTSRDGQSQQDTIYYDS